MYPRMPSQVIFCRKPRRTTFEFAEKRFLLLVRFTVCKGMYSEMFFAPVTFAAAGKWAWKRSLWRPELNLNMNVAILSKELPTSSVCDRSCLASLTLFLKDFPQRSKRHLYGRSASSSEVEVGTGVEESVSLVDKEQRRFGLFGDRWTASSSSPHSDVALAQLRRRFRVMGEVGTGGSFRSARSGSSPE